MVCFLSHCGTGSRSPSGKGSKSAGELPLTALIEDVRDSVLIQRGQKRGQRLTQHSLETADFGDRTSIRIFVETFGDPQIRLCDSYHFAETDKSRLARKRHTARTAGLNSDVIVVGERLNYANQVIF